MTGQTTSSDILSLRFEAGDLDSNNKFQLNRKRLEHLGRITIITFERERSVTIFCKSLTRTGFDLLEALRSGLLELVESGKDSLIIPPPSTPPQPYQFKVPPKPSPDYRQMPIGVSADTTHKAWKEILQPKHTYGLRFSENNGEVFACYSDEFNGEPEDLPPDQRLPVGREGDTYYFTVHDDPAPPKIFARLEMPRYAHLTGPIPFTFAIEYTTDSHKPFVVDKSRSPLSVFDGDLTSLKSLINCRNKETGEKVPWCGFIGCWDGDPHPAFPHDDDFIELSADKPWRFECTLDNLDDQDENVRTMEGLEASQTYTARIDGLALVAFNPWQYGTKEDLLKGTQEEKMARWKIDETRLGYLDVERIGEDVEFETIA